MCRGLLTSGDGKQLGMGNVAAQGEEIFPDDVTLAELRKIFAPAQIFPIHDGFEFRRVLKGENFNARE